MVFCHKCGAENKEGSKFCIKCGAALAPAKRRIQPLDLIKKASIKCGAALAPAKRGVDIKMKYCFVGSLITSLVGAIMLLIVPFASWTIKDSWYDSYWEEYEHEYYYYDIAGLYGDDPLSSVIILCLVALLLYGAYVSFLGLRSGETPLALKKLKRAFYGATTVFLGCLIGGMVFMLAMDSVDPLHWMLDAGFYGGFFFGGLTAGLLAIAYRMRRRG